MNQAIDYADQLAPTVEFYRDQLKGFFADIREGAGNVLGNPVDEAGFRLAALRVIEMQDATMEQIKAVPDKRKVACKEGCIWCCYQSIYPSTPELAMIALHLRDAGLAAEVSRRARDTEARIARGGERYARAIACPLLVSRRCAVYAVRPACCRGHFSMSKLACQKDWDLRASPKYGTGKGVPFVGKAKVFGEIMALGLDAACLDRGLHIAKYPIEQALPAILAEGAVEMWLGGGNPWQGLAERRNEIDGAPYREHVAGAFA